jgi:hypothetical protein
MHRHIVLYRYICFHERVSYFLCMHLMFNWKERAELLVINDEDTVAAPFLWQDVLLGPP